MSFGNEFKLDYGYERGHSIAAERAAFIRRTYAHLAGAILAFVGLEAALLSIPGIGVHSTNAPESVFSFSTHGCIRMQPSDIAAIFDDIPMGTTGRIVYIRFHGAAGKYRGRYSDAALLDWAEWMTAQNRPVWAYFNNDTETAAIHDALTLKAMARQASR